MKYVETFFRAILILIGMIIYTIICIPVAIYELFGGEQSDGADLHSMD
jgi:hypothetical protein